MPNDQMRSILVLDVAGGNHWIRTIKKPNQLDNRLAGSDVGETNCCSQRPYELSVEPRKCVCAILDNAAKNQTTLQPIMETL